MLRCQNQGHAGVCYLAIKHLDRKIQMVANVIEIYGLGQLMAGKLTWCSWCKKSVVLHSKPLEVICLLD